MEQKLAALSDLGEHIKPVTRRVSDEEFEALQEACRAFHKGRELELRAEHARAVRVRQGRVGA